MTQLAHQPTILEKGIWKEVNVCWTNDDDVLLYLDESLLADGGEWISQRLMLTLQLGQRNGGRKLLLLLVLPKPIVTGLLNEIQQLKNTSFPRESRKRNARHDGYTQHTDSLLHRRVAFKKEKETSQPW